MLSLRNKKRAHLIGIGGISLSAIAKLLLSYGWTVTGSDRVYSERIVELLDRGAEVWVGSFPDRIGLPDLCVYSGAVHAGDPELNFCRCLGIPCYERKTMLTEISENYGCVIGVAGTHGKTTVTAMITHLFCRADKRFTAHIGGESEYGNFVRTGEDWFITEACEYRRSMLSLHPDLGIVLNAESDHPDTYRTLSDLYDAFDDYLRNSRLRIVCGDTPYYKARQSHEETVTYGFEETNRFRAIDLKRIENGCYGFTILDYGNLIATVQTSVPGEHNVKNALCAFVVGRLNGLDTNRMIDSISTFHGVKRRFEIRDKKFGATVVSDYAHHPDEIRATLLAARAYLGPSGRILAVFQPHTYSRTQRLFDEFCAAFSGCDEVLIVKEYPARETPDCGKSAKELYEKIPFDKKEYFPTLLDVAVYLQKNVAPGDMILLLGAGDVDIVSELL